MPGRFLNHLKNPAQDRNRLAEPNATGSGRPVTPLVWTALQVEFPPVPTKLDGKSLVVLFFATWESTGYCNRVSHIQLVNLHKLP
jgi:hypothetical protein